VRYPVVLLDVGETLIGPISSFGDVYAGVWRELGLHRSAEEFERGLRLVWQEMSRLIPPGTDRYGFFAGGEDEYWLRFSRSAVRHVIDDEPDDRLLAEALERLREAFRHPAAWRVYPDVPPALAALDQAGARLGVVSNWDSRLPRLLDDLDLSRRFETIGVSHLVGCEKPHPGLFHHVLERLGTTPDQALHVGDVPELDLAGAKAAGVACVIVDRRGRIDPGAGLPVIDDLSSLPRLAAEGLDGMR